VITLGALPLLSEYPIPREIFQDVEPDPIPEMFGRVLQFTFQPLTGETVQRIGPSARPPLRLPARKSARITPFLNLSSNRRGEQTPLSRSAKARRHPAKPNFARGRAS